MGIRSLGWRATYSLIGFIAIGLAGLLMLGIKESRKIVKEDKKAAENETKVETPLTEKE